MKLNNTNFTSWDASTFNDGNSSGFSAFPAGGRVDVGGFYNRGLVAYFWEATENDASNAYNRFLLYGFANILASNGNKAYGLSVRCLRDN